MHVANDVIIDILQLLINIPPEAHACDFFFFFFFLMCEICALCAGAVISAI